MAQRFTVFLNRMGYWIIEDNLQDKYLLNIPNFIGFHDEETAIYFAKELNGLYDEIEEQNEHINHLQSMLEDYEIW